MRLTGTPSYTAPLCPGARSHTMILTPCSAQLRTTGAMETAFMFSVQFQMIWPSTPLTARLRYAHSYLYSTACSTFTPHGAHTLRVWPIRPTRISSAQYTSWGPPTPARCNCSVSPLFSRQPALRQKPWETWDGELSSLTPSERRPSACPNRCTPLHAPLEPTSLHPRWCVSLQLLPLPLVLLPAGGLTDVEGPHAHHADGSALQRFHLGGTKPPISVKSDNALLPPLLLPSSVCLCAEAKEHGAVFCFENPFLACKAGRGFVLPLANQSATVEPCFTSPIVLANYNT